MALIDKDAIRREVERKDAEREPAVRQWGALPVGTKLTSKWTEEFVVAPGIGSAYPNPRFLHTTHYIIDTQEPSELGVLDIHPSSYADTARRDTLAKLGFFSVDDPDHRARRIEQAYQEALRVAAAEALGIDRAALLDKVAAGLADRTPEGIWPKSTAAYAKRRNALDVAILYAAGVIDHA